jgi:hypothetical protein
VSASILSLMWDDKKRACARGQASARARLSLALLSNQRKRPRRARVSSPTLSPETVNGHRGGAVAVARCDMPSGVAVEMDRLAMREMT